MTRSWIITFLAVMIATSAVGQSVTVTAPVRAGQVIDAGDLAFAQVQFPDGFNDPRDIIGLEARVNLYPGRPIRDHEVGLPTVVQRNAIVPLIFQRGGLTITLEGRALQRAGEGEPVRIMNLSSRSTVTGVATASGAVIVD